MAIHRIDALTLKQWLDTNQSIAIIDVREPDEYAAAHLAGATLLPLANIESLDIPQFSGKKLVVHCLRGRRSDDACHRLTALHPNIELFDLEGGISAWIEAGYPVKTA